MVTLIPQVQDSIARFEFRDTGISSSPFSVSQAEPIFPDLDSNFFPPSKEPIPIIRKDKLLYNQPKFSSPPPLIDPSLEKILSDLDPNEKLERYHQDLAADKYLYGPTIINQETRVTEHYNPVSVPSLQSIDHNSLKKQNEKRKQSIEIATNANKKLKTEGVKSKRTSGISVGYSYLHGIYERSGEKVVANALRQAE